MRRLILGGCAIGATALGWWAFWYEPRNVVLRRRTLESRHWTHELGGLTIAVVSDLHTGAPHVGLGRLHRLVRRINRAHPDVIVLLGDYADPAVYFGERVEPEAVAAELGRLRAPLGSYAVLGNHDWIEHGRRMPLALRRAGIRVLENEAVHVGHAGQTLWIAGLADATEREPSIRATLEDIPHDAPTLLLTHHPDLFPEVPDWVALTLAGHTHGAQVDIPVVRDRMTPSKHGADYTGLVEENGRVMFVSPGVGTSRLAVRFRARPEVTLLRLEPAA